ncbi:helix-turn-helix domain-containing protein [Herbidospora sp. NEAU-GS84]|uniref:Helix-turn-helix domain-containing protein n=1 Tax=Herbidospora solisilvae TaxID=2696284 RepID=A0A7C9JE68_9ACTN|nr:XRE family transcriptional regulator [Herbidospora solisilvae]NAS24341.1 helix-turn-helix domain-containing protein [Herbidospora solisilvae]
MDAQEIGRRLRDLREAKGMSLSALARAAGVGKATMSGLETGTRNPTMETLWKVTAALEVPLTALLSSPAVLPDVAVEGRLLESFTDATVTYELYHLVIKAGGAQISPAHGPGVTEHLTIFSGVAEVGPEASPLTGGPGDHLVWTSDTPHLYAARGPEDVQASLLIRYP